MHSWLHLRYGWFSELRPKTVEIPSRSTHLGDGFEAKEKGCSTISELADIRKEEVLDFKPTNLSKLADAALTTNMHSDVPVDYMVVDQGGLLCKVKKGKVIGMLGSILYIA